MRFCVFLLLILLALPSHALLEIRGQGTYLSVDPVDLNQRHRDYIAPFTRSLLGYGLDALIQLPGVPIGFGIRYETMSAEGSTPTSTVGEYKYETGFSRIALLVNKRLIDDFWYLGPIFGIGITNNVWYDLTAGGQADSYRTVGGTSVSVAAESGLKLSRLILGAEAGYMFAEFKTPKNASRSELTSSAGRVGLDFSGPYFKLLVGYELL
jgi:hypothetical protein